MSKKRKPEIETELRAAQPEEVLEWSRQLAGLTEENKAIRAKAKAAAREFKAQLEANEGERERLSRMIITQQEEVPVKRQMTLAEIEDRRRHELSLEAFRRESEAFDRGGDTERPTDAAGDPERGDGLEPETHVDAKPEAPASVDDAQAEEAYRAYDRMRIQMRALQEKALSPRDDDESRYIARMIEETWEGLTETERDWTAFVESDRERAELIHRKVSGEHEAFDRERMEKMVKDIQANRKLSFESLARFGYEYEFVVQAEAIGLIHRKTNLSNFEAGPGPSNEGRRDEGRPNESPQAPGAPDPNTIEGGLYRALHSFAGAKDRWQRCRVRGATDAELKQAITREFGESGSSGGPGMKSVAYRGGDRPAFWFDGSPPAKPTLTGKALVDKAREVMRIGQRKEAKAGAGAGAGVVGEARVSPPPGKV